MTGTTLSLSQKIVLGAAFVPMLATGVAGGVGTYTNIESAYGSGTAAGAVAAGEGATAVLALTMLGLTMLGQAAPAVVRAGLWLLPAAAAAMSYGAADNDTGQQVIYAVTPMGMTVAAEGMAFLARRIVVHQSGRDVEAEARAAATVRALAFHRARAAQHPSTRVQKRSERHSWRLARRVGAGDTHLAQQLLDVQRDRVSAGADAVLADMFHLPVAAESATGTGVDTAPNPPPAPPVEVDLERVPTPLPAEVGTTRRPALDTAPDSEAAKVSTSTPEHAPEATPPVGVDTPTGRVNTIPDAPVSTRPDTIYHQSDQTPKAQRREEGHNDPDGLEGPLVICGELLPASLTVPKRPRLDTAAALHVIETGWKTGRSCREVARRATRSPSYVQQVYTRLDTDNGPRPVPGQLAFTGARVEGA